MSRKEPTEEQRKLALEVFGDEKTVNYMLLGADLRAEMTLKLLDRVLSAEKRLMCYVKELSDLGYDKEDLGADDV